MKTIYIILIIIALLILAAIIVYINIPKQTECFSNLNFNACFLDNRTRIEINNPGEKITQMDINLGNKNLSLANIANGKTVYDFSSEDIFRIEVNYRQEGCQKEEIIDVTSCKRSDDFGVSLDLGNTQPIKEEYIEAGIGSSQEVIISKCKSDWQCSNWGICQSGTQRRDCIDKNSCPLASPPEFEQTCKECKENWQCNWQECDNGVTVPSCTDLNNCGTEFSKPSTLSCKKQDCQPEISCGAWSQCNLNYNLDNLNNLEGTMSRLCTDQSGCIQPVYEYKKCSTSADIYIKESNGFLELYDKNNKLIGKLKYHNDSLDLNFYT